MDPPLAIQDDDALGALTKTRYDILDKLAQLDAPPERRPRPPRPDPRRVIRRFNDLPPRKKVAVVAAAVATPALLL